MIKTNSLKQDVSVIDAFRVLVIGSNFELRISDFLNENLVFVQALLKKVDLSCHPEVVFPGRPFPAPLSAFARTVQKAAGFTVANVPADLHFLSNSMPYAFEVRQLRPQLFSLSCF